MLEAAFRSFRRGAATGLVGCALACAGEISPADVPTATNPEVPRDPGMPPRTTQPPETPGRTSACAATPRPGPAPLRRLTRVEYDNTVRDLLGDQSHPARAFAPEERVLGFDNNADVLGVTPLLAEQQEAAADRLAWEAVRNLPALMGCDPATGDACVRTFVTSFGKRAFRRPLTPAEVTRFVTFATAQKTAADQATAVRLVVKAFLLSPAFLYRIETGAGGRPTAHEMASRLSYLLWSTMPDGPLMDAADAGQLATPEQIAAQARRMLADPRAREPVERFFSLWLDLDRLEDLDKDVKAFPKWRAEHGHLLRQQARAFLDDLVFTRKGSLKDLLSAQHTLANKALADLYGMKGPTGTAFVETALDPARAAGLLSLPGTLAAHAKPNQTSPIERGRFVREQLLCQALSPPPMDLMVTAPDPDPRLTTRARFAEHNANPACSGCHRLIDPIGFGFENYDGVGQWRDTENGMPVDASGELTATKDADGPFVGVSGLGRKLAASSDVQACFALQWLRYGYGRAETDDDACTRERLEQAARTGDLLGVLVALTQTDAFLYRQEGATR